MRIFQTYIVLDPALGAEGLHGDAAKPAQDADQDRGGDLVDHRARDQEGEGHSQRDARLDEADEERHRGAGAEGRHRTEGDGHPARLPVRPVAHEGTHPLRREERAQQTHHIDDENQEQEDLGHVHHEELQGRPEMGLGAQP
jgi:hypothetical protein